VAEEVITQSAEETIAWGRAFAETLAAPVLVLLSGELGSGKTTLTKGIVAGLHAAAEDEVTSPTFTLLHEYGTGGKYFTAICTGWKVFTTLKRWEWKTCSPNPQSSFWNGRRNSL